MLQPFRSVRVQLYCKQCIGCHRTRKDSPGRKRRWTPTWRSTWTARIWASRSLQRPTIAVLAWVPSPSAWNVWPEPPSCVAGKPNLTAGDLIPKRQSPPTCWRHVRDYVARKVMLILQHVVFMSRVIGRCDFRSTLEEGGPLGYEESWSNIRTTSFKLLQSFATRRSFATFTHLGWQFWRWWTGQFVHSEHIY